MNLQLKLLFTAGVAAAAVTPSAWHYRKLIPVKPSDALAVVKLDADVYTHARADLGDLRVLRDGEEVPYVLETLGATSQNRERTADILDQSVTPGVGLQFTLRLNAGDQHDRVRLETGERNFRQPVRIETSEDGKRWSLARASGAIFDFSQGERRLSSLTVAYPVSTRPFLRVTIRGWTKVGAVTGAHVDYHEERSASRETFATLTPQISEDSKTQSTLLTLDAGADRLPVDLVRIETSSPSFHRAVEVESSTNGQDWDYVAQGVIERMPSQESLTISIPEVRRRRLRVRVYNRDDHALKFGAVRLEGLIRRIKFGASSAGTYWLYCDNENASAPTYDLPILLARREHVEEYVWNLGAAEPNPDYRPPSRPWSERHPTILYTVLGGAVVGLAVATLRFALTIRGKK